MTVEAVRQQAANKAFGLDAPLPGYGVDVLQWELEVFPGNPPMNFSGTIQQAAGQINEINPEWYATYIQSASEEGSRSVDKRGSFDKTFCGSGPHNWQAAFTPHVEEGIKHLDGAKGRPVNGPGPGNCGRVSCSYNSAIWWCNDKNRPQKLGSFGDIADGARDLLDFCSAEEGVWVLGQVFMQWDWNVIVRWDEDSC
ncbi:Uncharacterized protein TCAP_03253 [Tolypocladium capitatum]|uniref:Uncharacterized protein n=1 Tax=Tolypocladium capitatum TaxID=45235 RepID=A0A2K3QH20_9HYPO|nr:Uncharacterized protein TCAP_03253 [Tolypocladium capitatum]